MILSPDHHLVDAEGQYLWSADGAARAWTRVTQEVRYLLPQFDRLVLLVGLPAAGKSTWVTTPGNQDPKALFIDATFVARSWRTPFIQMARQAGKPVDAIVFMTPFPVILERNSHRPATRTPPVEKLKLWQETLIKEFPTVDEGFRIVHPLVP